MKQVHSNVLISSAAACVVLAAQPVLAQTTQITEVKLNPVDGGISVILTTSSGNKPQIFTTKRDKALVADIINTQLRLPQGKSFRQEKPAPGIASVEVNQLDANSVRVTVMGINNAPAGKPVVRENNNLTLGFTTTGDATAAAPTPNTTPTTPNTNTTASAPPTPPGGAVEFSKQPDVLVPNPEITIDGKKAQPAGPNQPYNLAPPFLPRAVAPPVGDITVSNIDTSPTVIDLGTQERVPRLVLRDAPVREVLSLLARAAGLNLAYVGAEGAAPTAGQTISQTISLDIENEPVQDVFNYVLRLSGLEANRSGRTIFVGAKLPNSTRDTVMRSLRLNQVTVGVALDFLVALGAESAVSRERLVTSVNAVTVGDGVAPITQTQTTTETKIETQRIDYKDSTPVLRGLQASGDERTNSVTLIGSPKLVDMAVSQLTKLDVRRRQVVVNLRIIDVNLLGIQESNSSFSFGIGNNTLVSNDGGVATFNFGNRRPFNSTDLGGTTATQPQTQTPIYEETRPNIIAGQPPSSIGFPRRFLASLRAQVKSGNAKILTDPTLIVQEGQVASVGLISQVYGGIDRNDEPIIKNAGLTLSVKVDRIDDNGFVSLSVAPTVASISGTAPTPFGTITLLALRSLDSGQLRLRDGQTLILSGIIQDTDRSTVTKVPILGDIPLLGSLFRRTDRTNERREVIVLLTPQVMDDSERSSYGYNYNPSPQVRDMLERRGLRVPGSR
ncbi:AMIN domain-containing protein [Anabaena aphanizomenioides LEGE 00250]|uniref:AMIN domain-containing protein n=1 Tax=Sphaerospermopsis aphanizomenoides LEGE 00250 TaxID=2777972 RepID=A0ABR9VHH6_9CYAN|nr:type IV pilus secretin family protein [Sphaerospermopsis aphanizomenoides]MBE9237680.1 AMIN domain-containing protein [Sphaerospermopsis aphanizomenoides LEGE 00250]